MYEGLEHLISFSNFHVKRCILLPLPGSQHQHPLSSISPPGYLPKIFGKWVRLSPFHFNANIWYRAGGLIFPVTLKMKFHESWGALRLLGFLGLGLVQIVHLYACQNFLYLYWNWTAKFYVLQRGVGWYNKYHMFGRSLFIRNRGIFQLKLDPNGEH